MTGQLAARLWQRDTTLWRCTPPVTNGLGWLDSIPWMQERAASLTEWAGAMATSGRYNRVMVIGMGGSGAAAAVFAALFPVRGLPLEVIDTTHPEEVAQRLGGDLRRCLFVVASQSGDTLETVRLYHLVRARLKGQGDGAPSPFVLITTAAGAPRMGPREDFARVFINPDEVGGRYSALSYFGMVPAALLGVPIDKVLKHARDFSTATFQPPSDDSPAVALGSMLGCAAVAGRDKVIIEMPPVLHPFGRWIEQLLAESSGKDGRGLVPVVGEAHGAVGADCVCIRIPFGTPQERDAAGAPPADQPPDQILPLHHPTHIGAEFFRWQVATAIAAHHLKVNPFNQPDVAAAKTRTRAFLAGHETFTARPHPAAAYDIYAAGDPAAAPATHSTETVITAFVHTLHPGNYLALLAYLPETPPVTAALQTLAEQIGTAAGMVVTIGMGPRYLHSTGQLHKGGPTSGRFLQLVDDGAAPAAENRDHSFAELHRAQADGDFTALAEAARPVMRVHLKGDRLGALATFASDFTTACTAAPTPSPP